MNEQISAIQTGEVLELMRNLAPILNQKELFEFMLFSNRVVERYMPEHYSDGLSEEVTEMRKDKAWLRDKVSELYPSYNEMYVSPDYETVAKTETISKVLEFINQLDELEVKRLDKKIKELESYNDELIRDNNQLRNELDNQEVLSQEWIESHTASADTISYYSKDNVPVVTAFNLKGLLVPKQEEVTHKQVEKYLIDKNIRVIDIDIYEEMQSELEELKNGVTIPQKETVADLKKHVFKQGKTEMRKDKEWLKEELMGLKFKISEIGKVRLGEVFELVDQLDEPTKPVIPQFVADWYEENLSDGYIDNRNKFSGNDVFRVIQDVLETSEGFKVFENYGIDKKIATWAEENEEDFIHLIVNCSYKDGYKVEKEKLYCAKIKGHELVETEIILDEDTGDDVSEFYRNVYFVLQSNGDLIVDMKDNGLSGAKNVMTLSQWNNLGINEANADFEEVQQ